MIESNEFGPARRRMVETQLKSRDITDPRVLDALLRVPRHLFVEKGLQNQAYSDRPLQIGEYQTISQPYIVALMTQLLNLKGTEKVLEIGTGSGYQAAVLALLAEEVYTIERIESLHRLATRIFNRLGLDNIFAKQGDGTLGWPEEAPFDGIIVTAGAPDIPSFLLDQLALGGRLVIPVGDRETQILKVVRRTKKGLEEIRSAPCRFVKLIGKEGWPE